MYLETRYRFSPWRCLAPALLLAGMSLPACASATANGGAGGGGGQGGASSANGGGTSVGGSLGERATTGNVHGSDDQAQTTTTPQETQPQGPANPSPSRPPVRSPIAPVEGCAPNKDHISIQVTQRSNADLYTRNRATLDFRSGDPDQDREFVETSTKADVRIFHENHRSIDVVVPEGATLVFSFYYYNVTGTRYRMNCGADVWSIGGVAPGDVVEVSWGHG